MDTDRVNYYLTIMTYYQAKKGSADFMNAFVDLASLVNNGVREGISYHPLALKLYKEPDDFQESKGTKDGAWQDLRFAYILFMLEGADRSQLAEGVQAILADSAGLVFARGKDDTHKKPYGFALLPSSKSQNYYRPSMELVNILRQDVSKPIGVPEEKFIIPYMEQVLKFM